MMKPLILVLVLGGCTVSLDPPRAAAPVYTQAEIDAMHAQAVCRDTARTMLQFMRCEPAGRR